MPRRARGAGTAAAIGFGILASLVSASPALACANADTRIGSASARELREAIVCLVNRERTRRDLHGLVDGRRLTQAAGAHARDMQERDYFSHTSLDGRSFSDRIAAAGYMDAQEGVGWKVGETLAWAPTSTSQPSSIVAALMNSRPHRRVILEPDYHELGVGLVAGTPTRRPGVTVAIDYGSVVWGEAPAQSGRRRTKRSDRGGERRTPRSHKVRAQAKREQRPGAPAPADEQTPAPTAEGQPSPAPERGPDDAQRGRGREHEQGRDKEEKDAGRAKKDAEKPAGA